MASRSFLGKPEQFVRALGHPILKKPAKTAPFITVADSDQPRVRRTRLLAECASHLDVWLPDSAEPKHDSGAKPEIILTIT